MKTITGLAIIAIIVMGVVCFINNSSSQVGSAPSGLHSTITTSTVVSVDTTAVKVFDSNPLCSSRIISTGASDIMISFGEVSPYTVASTTIGAFIGHYQAASSTAVYDSGTYGCGLLSVYSFSAQDITVTENN